jgi:AraC-like DNA-binding protein
MDVLSDVLKTVRLTGSIFFTSDLYEPWSVSSPPKELLRLHVDKRAECISLFHIITEGSCHFKVQAGKPFTVEKGSVIIFPHSHEHIMCSSFDLNPVPVAQLLTPDTLSGNAKIEYGGSGTKTQFICGYLLCDQRFNPLLGALPEIIILSPTKTNNENIQIPLEVCRINEDNWFFANLNQLTKEVLEKKSGSSTVIMRLTELMYIEVLRSYMNALPGNSGGWLAAVRDPEIGRALKFLHSNPEKKWNVEDLAQQVGVSRSAFARRFTELLGESPIHYLTSWRMQLAKGLLQNRQLSLAMVAEKIGYDSDVTFNRAFQRHVGVAPAGWRKLNAEKSSHT